MTKYYVDAEGNYIGAFEGVTPPTGSVEVPTAPSRADIKWNGSDWATPTVEQIRDLMPEITPRQLRLTLLSANITEDQVDAALVDNPSGKIEWKYATRFKRTHPLIAALAPTFSLTEEQVDSLWAAAADIA